jgi:diguanylate cyclase (GGDEF)-like protein
MSTIPAVPPSSEAVSDPERLSESELRVRLHELEQSERQLLIYAQDLRRSHEEVRAQLRKQTSLHSVNLAIAAALDVDEVVRTTLDGADLLLGYDGAALYIAEDAGGLLQLHDMRGSMPAALREQTLDADAGEPPLSPHGDLLSLPLRSGNRLAGWLRLRRALPPFSQDDLQLAELVAAQAAVGIQNARVFAMTHAQAITDGLTGLFNHRYFDQTLVAEIDRASRLNYPVGLLMADLDRFKTVNDTYGHEAGNELLRQIAQAVASSVRKTDMVARYGGDEIVVILPGCQRRSLAQVAEKVRTSAERVARRMSRTVPVTVSIGGAMFPEDANTATELVGSADRALYQAKVAGRNRVHLAENA